MDIEFEFSILFQYFPFGQLVSLYCHHIRLSFRTSVISEASLKSPPIFYLIRYKYRRVSTFFLFKKFVCVWSVRKCIYKIVCQNAIKNPDEQS